MGGNDGHAGVIHKFSRFAGAYPPNMWSKGGILKTLVRRGPVSTNDVLEKSNNNKKGVSARQGLRHLASASELNLRQSEARAGASRGRVWPIPPFDKKTGGYTPL